MRRSRRRRSRPLWFPPLGSTFTIGDTTLTTGLVTFQVAVDQNGGLIEAEIPLTFDFGQEAILADATSGAQIPSLADLQGSSWRLRRVVGGFFAAFHVPDTGVLDAAQTCYPSAMCAAGLMVRKVDEFGQPRTNVNVLDRDDYDDPWLWRRSWVLGQDTRWQKKQEVRADNSIVNVNTDFWAGPASAAPAGLDVFAAYSRFPNTTAHYATAAGGHVIDQKTNRLIGPEDRLIMHIATKGLPIGGDDNFVTDAKVIGVFDLRYLGFLARSTNRRNASR